MADDALRNVVYFGRTDFRGANRLFGIKRKDRRQHTYVIGKTGTGKSVLLGNMIIQDIANGDGLCVVDPHGELVEGVLSKIPEERMDDVVYFNPADPDSHMGFNILEVPDPKYKHLIASGLMGIFTKIWANVWSARMEYIMNNAVLALIDTPGSTLLGITRLLVDKDFRQKIIANVQDPIVKAFWLTEFEQWEPRFRNEAIAPIQNKVGQFLSSALVRNIVGQPKSTIDIFKLMNERKIFLVNVSKGRIGEDNSALLGAMLITKIQLSAMERVRIADEESRPDFYLYVDEFQNFATDSFASILSEARKYRLNLIMAHQYVGQLITDTSTKVRDAVFGNVGTMIVFRVGAADAEALEKEFEPEFTIQDIVNLPNYRIYLKLMVDGVSARPFSALTLPPFNVKSSPDAVQTIIENSRRLYARSREAVEGEINRWSGMMGDGGGEAMAPSGIAAKRFKATCSNCGKATTVPFEPTPGRPLYCEDCFLKVKGTEPDYKKKNDRYVPHLANLGIEFSERKGDKPAGDTPERRPQPQPRPSVPTERSMPQYTERKPSTPGGRGSSLESTLAARETSESKEAPSSISLSALKSDTKQPRQKQAGKEIDIAELRREITEALQRASSGE